LAQDPYTELGVARGAKADEVRRAFRKLAKELHPDKNPGNAKAEERFKRVSAAFDILGDEEKRKKFDRGEIDADGREISRGFNGGGGYGGGDPFGRGGPGAQAGFGGGGFEGVDLNDIFGEILGGRGGRGFGGPAKGQDVRAKVEIDLEDAIQGGRKRIAFADGRTIEVNIPKGAIDGQMLRLKGQGAPGRAGPGDAIIELAFKPHPTFRREGDNLIMDLPVTVPDAVLGAKVEAQTPDGPVTLTVPKGANGGQTLRLKGRGLPTGRAGVRGDLMAKIQIVLPEPPDPLLLAFAETWRAERPYVPRRKS
jgi:DnaJ-class molecular chaperone